MFGNGFQYNLRHVGCCSNVDQIWNVGPLTYRRNTSQNAKQPHDHLKQILLLQIWGSQSLELLESMCTVISKFRNVFFAFWVCVTLELWFVILEFRKFEALKLWKFETLKEETKKPINQHTEKQFWHFGHFWILAT